MQASRNKMLTFMGLAASNPAANKIQFDEQATYSITYHTISEKMCAHIKKYMAKPKVIIDGTASVGLGDARMFWKKFRNATVYAIEMDDSRYRMLEHNIAALKMRITPMNGSVLDIVPALCATNNYNRNETFLFVDPPWGGGSIIKSRKN